MRTILIVVGIGLALYMVFIFSLYLAGKRTAVRSVGGFIPDCIVLFKRLLSDENLPKSHKVAIFLLVIYLASPIDIIPDFIPIAGQLDDAILVILTLRYVLKGAGRELAVKHWPGPHNSLNSLLNLARVR